MSAVFAYSGFFNHPTNCYFIDSELHHSEIEQSNLGRIHIDKGKLTTEVARNGGRIVFDARGYEQFKAQEGLDEPFEDTQQLVRPRAGAMHDRGARDQGLGRAREEGEI